MKLIIKNFAKIKNATVDIDAITVIAGLNNTGKSTVGKIVFSVFNSLNDLQKKIFNNRKREIQKILEVMFRNNIMHGRYELDREFDRVNYRKISNQLSAVILEQSEINAKAIYSLIEDKILTIEGIASIVDSDMLLNIADRIYKVASVPNHSVALEIITRYFNEVFSRQVNDLNDPEKEAVIQLVIKDKFITLKFVNHKCIDYQHDLNILHESYYIDNPFIIDELENEYYGLDKNMYLADSLRAKFRTNVEMEGLFDAVLAQEKLQEIYKVINEVIDGQILFNESSDELVLNKSNYANPIRLKNLSTGLKSFVIIKLLLEKGVIKEKDVLILDEPEIHLHPEWQLLYAQLIVLIQKAFDLNVIITTHSAHFLEAVEFYTKEYDTVEKCHFYLAKVENDLSEFEDVSHNSKKIYSQMVEPSILLDQLKYKREEENDND